MKNSKLCLRHKYQHKILALPHRRLQALGEIMSAVLIGIEIHTVSHFVQIPTQAAGKLIAAVIVAVGDKNILFHLLHTHRPFLLFYAPIIIQRAEKRQGQIAPVIVFIPPCIICSE